MIYKEQDFILHRSGSPRSSAAGARSDGDPDSASKTLPWTGGDPGPHGHRVMAQESWTQTLLFFSALVSFTGRSCPALNTF